MAAAVSPLIIKELLTMPLSEPSALSVIHKYIRLELFTLAAQLSRATPADCPEVRNAVTGIARLLRRHAETEDQLLEPKLRALNRALADHMADDHRHLEEQLARMLVLVEDLEPSQPRSCRKVLSRLHLDWMKFVGEYLLHLDDEERVLFPPLGALPPVALVAQTAATLPVGERETFMAKLANALTADEFRQISATQTTVATA